MLLEAVGVDLDDAPERRLGGAGPDRGLPRRPRTGEAGVAGRGRRGQAAGRPRAQAKAAELQQQAQQAVQAAQQLETTVTAAVDDILTALAGCPERPRQEVAAALAEPLQALRNATPTWSRSLRSSRR